MNNNETNQMSKEQKMQLLREAVQYCLKNKLITPEELKNCKNPNEMAWELMKCK